MPSLIDIRRRIRSVKNTQQITKAMKMVSAAKLRRAQDRTIAARPYGTLLRKVLGNVAAAVANDESAAENPLLARREESRILLVVITGDKGLAGAFNTNLIKAADAFCRRARGRADHVRADRPQRPRFLPQARGRRLRRSRRAGGEGEVRRYGGDRAPRHGAVPQRRDRRGLPGVTTSSRAWSRRS